MAVQEADEDEDVVEEVENVVCTLHVVLPFVFPEGDCVIHVDCIVHVSRPHWVIMVPLLIIFLYNFTIFLSESQKRENKEEHANSQNSKITERN